MLKNKPEKKVRGKQTLSTFGMGQERDYFVENLAMLLDSGMNVLAALQALRAQTRSGRLKRVIQQIEGDIDAGYSLSKALGSSNFLPAHVISLIKIGEETGRLPESLKVVSVQQQKDRSFQSKVRSAMIYPTIVLSLAFVIGIGVIWFILPRLASVFSGLRVQLPLMTRLLIDAGAFLKDYGIYIMPAFILIVVIAVLILFVFPRTKASGRYLLFKFPGIKNLIQEVELARFGYILGNLLEAGLPIGEALDSLYQASTMGVYRKLFSYMRDSIDEGNSFQKSLVKYPRINTLIPIPIQQMIISAEQSGKLAPTLLKIGKNYEEKSEITTKNLAVVLEPILLVIVWLAVLIVALSVILPIYSLVGSLEQVSNTSNTSTPPASTGSQPAEQKESTPADNSESDQSNQDNIPALVRIVSSKDQPVKVYKEPSLESEALTLVRPNRSYQCQTKEGDWYLVVLADQSTGWVAKEFVEEISD